MRSLWAHWPLLRQEAVSAGRLAVLLDFDGTLVPIADHPSGVCLEARTRYLLRRIASDPDVSVALVSGRALRDLKELVGIRGLYYVGNHGLELQGPKLRYLHPVARESRLLLGNMAEELKTVLRPIQGAWVEDKGLTLSVHWRRTPQEARRRFHGLVARCTAPYRRQGAIRVARGKRVVEILPPVDWDKGDAVAWLLRNLPRRPNHAVPFVVYVGDDRTDEDAFGAVNRLGGVSVAVGGSARRTAAAYRLKDSRDVSAWLEELGHSLRVRPTHRRNAR